MSDASFSLADPLGPSPLLAAVVWVQAIFLGKAAALVAIIAVAALGATMLSGRIDIRRSALVILGCFIVFGAPAIAAGIRSALSTGDELPGAEEAYASPPPSAAPLPPPPVAPYDPYAGAAVPVAR